MHISRDVIAVERLGEQGEVFGRGDDIFFCWNKFCCGTHEILDSSQSRL